MTATRFAKASTLVALAAGWLVAAWLLTRTTVPGNLHAPHVDARARCSRPACCTGRARYDGLLRWLWVASTLVTLAALVVFVRLAPRIARRLGAGPRRDRRDGRRGDDARRLGGRAPVRRGAALVGPALRARAAGLPRVGARAVAGAGRAGRRPDDRADRPDAARRALRPRAGGSSRRRCSSRSARCWCSCCRGSRRSARGRRTTRPSPPGSGSWPGRGRGRDAGPDRGRPRRDDAPRTRCRPASALRRASSSGTRSSTAATPAARSRWSPRTSSGTSRTATSGRGSRWSLLLTVPGFWLVERRRAAAAGSSGRRSCPLALLVLALIGLAVTPLGNAVSRRYEAEADWSALRATHDPAARGERLPQVRPHDLVQPNPPALVVHLDRRPPDGGAADRDGPRLARR